MGVEALDTNLDLSEDAVDGEENSVFGRGADVDARRRLEDKIEEMRLRREMQDFDL